MPFTGISALELFFFYILLIAGGNINEPNNFNFHDYIIRIFHNMGSKMKHPINRPENVKEDTETPWYETKYQAPKADDEWTLDPEIPLNYIPVPGEDELYMVVDDSGNITNYRKRVKQADGSWVWQDVNPDIPDNYEKVDGLDNVYKVTNKDGTTEYKQYVRNDDDTYCFVPVDIKR